MNLFQLATSGIDTESLPSSRQQEEPAGVAPEPLPVYGRKVAVPAEIDSIIQEAAATYGVDPNVVRGVAFAESGFDPDVISGKRRSSAGAVGLMQFMPQTAKELDIDPLNVREAIFGGAYYLRKNLDKFDGDYGRAVAAYNWGPNRDAFSREDWFAAIPKETDDYVKRVFAVADSFGAEPGAEPEKSQQIPLPEGVQPSGAGGGRGSVSPGMTNTKITRVAVPDMTAGGLARDVASGVLQIGPTAVKGVGELARLVSGDNVGKGLTDFADRGNKAIQEVVGSERAQAQRQNFAADMADEGVSIGSALMNNKGAMADMALPQLGSMLIPVGVAGAAGKAATVGKAAQVLDKAALASRVAAVQQAAGIGATAAQNAASTFAELVDKGVSLKDAYLGAGITVPFSVIAGKLTGGGAEGALIRSTLGDAVKKGAAQVPKAMLREGGQEVGEELGQVLGEAVGTGKTPSVTAAGKQLAVAGVLGGLMGGSMDVATQAMAPRVEAQPTTPQAPVVPKQEPTIDVTYQTADGRTVTDVVPGAPAPVAPAQAVPSKAAADGQSVDSIAKAILEAESKAAQPAAQPPTGLAAELEALRARNKTSQSTTQQTTEAADAAPATGVPELGAQAADDSRGSAPVADAVRTDADGRDAGLPGAPAPSRAELGTGPDGGRVDGNDALTQPLPEIANAQAPTQTTADTTRPLPAARPAAVEAAGPATIPATTGVASEPQASQTQQGNAQPTQAGGPQAGPAPTTASTSPTGGNRVQAAGLTNGTTTQNTGAQTAPAAGPQTQAPQGPVARPDGWRKSMLRAAPIARSMGIDPKGKRLAQVLAEIDARDTRAPAPPAPQPTSPTAGVPAEGAPSTAPTIVEVQDHYGRTHRVRQSDLYGNADRIPTVRKNGDVVAGEEIPRSIVKGGQRAAAQQAQAATETVASNSAGQDGGVNPRVPRENRAQAKPVEQGEQKEPWQMTAMEFGQQERGNPHWNQSYAGKDDGAYLADVQKTHARLVQEAVDAGLVDATERAADAQAARDEERKRIAQASVRAADTFELGQDPLDSLTGQGGLMFSRRSASGNRLPDVVIGHRLGALSSHPEYEAAKAGDSMAAARIASDLVDDAMVEAVRQAAGNADLIVPVVSLEATGRNKIPLAVARELADRLGSAAETEIVQADSPKRTNMDGLSRLLNPPVFDGPVTQGAAYVLVDDTVTQGGTFASLASHIRDNGGEVAGVVALTGKQYSAKLEPSSELLQQVRDRFQSVEPAFRSATGYGFDALTESEARYLVKHDDAESVRNRILATGSERINGGDRGLSQAFAREQSSAAQADSNARNVATHQLVDGLIENWTRAPEIIVARNMQDMQIPQEVRNYDQTLKSQGATGEPRGFIYKNKVYLLSDELSGPQQIAEVLFHEALGHYGLRGVFGDSLKPILQQMGTLRRSDVIKKAREYGMAEKGLSDSATWAAMSEQDRLAAAEEVLAEMAQSTPDLGIVQRAIAAIRTWLRSNVPGFKDMGLTDAEIVRSYILPARGYVTSSKETPQQSLQRAMMAFNRGGNPTPPIPTSAQNGLFNTPPWQLPEATHTDKLIYELQDGRVDLKRVQEAIAATGKTITEGFDARLAETLLPGRVARRTETFLTVEAKPLLESMARNNVSQDELSDYLLARHAPERNAQVAKVNPDMPDGGAGTNSQGVLMTTQAARDHIAALTAGKRTALELLARQVDAITAGTRDILVREGLEKQETIDAWMGAYKHYVPLFKDESMDTMAHPMGAGLSVTGSASRRATGSTGEVTNMLAHVLMQRETAITRAEKNRAAMSLYGLALTNPNAEMWTTIRPSMPADQIADELVRMGVDPMEAEVGMQGVPTIRGVDPVSGKVVDRPNPMYKRLDNALTVKVNGEDRVILFNAENERAMRLVRNLKNQDGVLAHLDLAGSFIGKATRYFASINTQYNPAFGMVNVIRDVGGALVNLSDTALAGKQARVLSDSIPAAIGIARDLRGDAQRTPWSDLWQQFQDDGGRTGYRDLFTDPYKRAEAVQSELDKLSKQGSLTPGAAAHAVLDLLDDFNTTLENGVRLSAYKAALDQGLSRAEAARLARELTLDFNRKGRTGREIGPLFAFFNASVQGTARTLKALQGPAGKRILIGGLGLGVMQALMLAAAGFEDDEIPEFVKARALIIPMPGKQYIAIPLQFGLNALPNTGRVATELLMSGGKDWGEKSFNALGELAGSFNPLGGGNIFTGAGLLKTVAPTVVDPIVDMATNTDFTGKPIGKERMPWDTRPGFAMARESTQRSPTGQVYVGISKAVNSLSGGNDFARGLASPSPEEVRYLFTSLGGGVYRELEKVLNASLLTAQGETLKAREVPLGSRFAGEVDDADVQRGRYFKNSARLEKLEAQLKGLSKEGRGEELRALVKENPEIKLYELNNQVGAELAKLNKLAVENVHNKDALKRIDEVRTQYMRALNDKVREMEKAADKAK